ncbi:MAG: T9SS type A sorting domain-containing protein, partial [Saprospiraceae bacterium]|nr:T9SS type A sorting domain-containing protein [Saprospiraceae bacterium]
SPEFNYSGDNQWFIEATANWFKAILYPNEINTFLTNEILLRLPQVPLWYGWFNRPAYHPDNWQRENHQYALGYFWYYFTEVKGVPRTTISEGFNVGTSLNPQEYYVQTIGLSPFREYFVDWVGDMVNGFQYLPSFQTQRARDEWFDYATLWDDKQFIDEYTNSGSGGWIRPADSTVTTAWSFNTFKINNSNNETYTFEIKGDLLSNEQDSSYFEGFLVIQNSISGTSITPLNIMNNQESNLSVNLTSQDTIVYFVVVSMPEVYEGVEKLFSYEARISTGAITGMETPLNNQPKFSIGPNPALDKTIIYLDAPAKRNLDVQIFSLNGQLMSTHNLQENDQILALPLETYTPGTYLVHIFFEDYRQIQPLIIK